jgi:hypothetical protein
VEPSPSRRLFRGSELPRLLMLGTVMVVGWGLVWRFANQRPQPAEPVAKVESKPESVVHDRADEFETVTDRTPMSFRDNAAYAYLLAKARKLTPVELAAQSRRDLLLTHLWERPELYRGVPIHLLGTARRVLRFESKLSKTGWLYEAWIVAPDAPKFPYTCVFEEAPKGFPLGADVSERVVFNGYFLKIMKYQAGDVARGAPVLVGQIGWAPAAAPAGGDAPAAESNRLLYWSLVVLGVMFLMSLGRWVFQLSRFLSGPRSTIIPASHPAEDIPPGELDAWVDSVANTEEEEPERDAT